MFVLRLLAASVPVAIFGWDAWGAFVLVGAGYGVGRWIVGDPRR